MRRKGREVQRDTERDREGDRRRSEEGRGRDRGAKDEVLAKEKKRGQNKREHNRLCRNGFVYSAGGETVGLFLCFGGSGLISPSVTSVSLTAVAKCDTKSLLTGGGNTPAAAFGKKSRNCTGSKCFQA